MSNHGSRKLFPPPLEGVRLLPLPAWAWQGFASTHWQFAFDTEIDSAGGSWLTAACRGSRKNQVLNMSVHLGLLAQSSTISHLSSRRSTDRAREDLDYEADTLAWQLQVLFFPSLPWISTWISMSCCITESRQGLYWNVPCTTRARPCHCTGDTKQTQNANVSTKNSRLFW